MIWSYAIWEMLGHSANARTFFSETGAFSFKTSQNDDLGENPMYHPTHIQCAEIYAVPNCFTSYNIWSIPSLSAQLKDL